MLSHEGMGVGPSGLAWFSFIELWAADTGTGKVKPRQVWKGLGIGQKRGNGERTRHHFQITREKAEEVVA